MTGTTYPLFFATLEDGVTYRCPVGIWVGDGGEVPTDAQIVILTEARDRGNRILGRVAKSFKSL